MKKIIYLAVVFLIGCLVLTTNVPAQEKSQTYEYAIVKWDGPDRLYFNLPGKFELVHLEEKGTKVPRDAQAEEYCLAVGANMMAKEGWEPVTLDSRRILFRRAVK
jgi:hypothetical protein